MKVNSLDSIVRNLLFKRGYSLHWYAQFLAHAADCLREINLHDLKVVETKLLSVNDYNAIDIPTDYVDYVQVGVKSGQHVKPLVPQDSINSLNSFDSSFNIQKYDAEVVADDESVTYNGFLPTLSWGAAHFNSYGEPIGRNFGMGQGAQTDTFKVIKERNQIQLNEALDVDEIVLQYIGDGSNADAATGITPYAVKTIEEYIIWQMKCANRNYSEGEKEMAKQQYLSERKVLRASTSDLTLDLLQRIINKNTRLSIK